MSPHSESKAKGKRKRRLSVESCLDDDEVGGGNFVGRRPCIDPECYKDNSLSLGGKVKQLGLVIHTRLEGQRLKQRLNVNCGVEKLGRHMSKFSEEKRRWVAEMGMESLFNLSKVGRLPRNLCYWLARRVDVPNKSLVTADGKNFPLSKIQVNWVLGIPLGSKKIPSKATSLEMESEMKFLWDEYSDVAAGTRGIRRKILLDQVLEEGVEEVSFKRAFLMMAMNDVLCPTTCRRLSVSLLPAATLSLKAKEYDWCSLVLDHLLHAIENFAKRFYLDGYAIGCGGCTIFLAILYLDRLRRPPLDWGVRPRLKVWSSKDINLAKQSDEMDSRDFGKLGCVDVAYAECHPLEARDRFLGTISKDVVAKIISAICEMEGPKANVSRVEREDIDGDRKAKETVVNVDTKNEGNAIPDGVGKVDDIDLENEVGSKFVPGVDLNVNKASAVEPDPCNYGSFMSSDKGVAWFTDLVNKISDSVPSDVPPFCSGRYIWDSGEDASGDVNIIEGEDDDGTRSLTPSLDDTFGSDDVIIGGSNSKPCRPTPAKDPNDLDVEMLLQRRRKQRKTKSSSKLSSIYVEVWRGASSQRTHHRKLFNFVQIGGGHLVSKDTAMIKCSGLSANLGECSTVVTSNCIIHPNYVRAAGKLYEKVWEELFKGRSRRLILDPDFGTNVVQSSTGFMGSEFCAKHSDLIAATSLNKLNLIFVPVLQDNHWWCCVFSLANSDIGVIDSGDVSHSSDSHHLDVIKLKHAMDDLVHSVHPSWFLGRCVPFSSYSVGIKLGGGKMLDNGVDMLVAMKRLAWRLKFDVSMDSPSKEVSWLLCEDVLCKHNEVRDDALSLLQQEMS